MNPYDQETTRGPVRPPGTTPRPEEKPYILGITGEHAGRLFPLEGLREVYIGRGADCEISLQLDRDVSRRHARVSIDETGRSWLEDLGSLNGTMVNGEDVSRPRTLGRGDRIYLGDSCIFKMDWLTADEVARWQSATMDALTECMNRNAFATRLEDLVEIVRAHRRPLSLILLDVDRFKSVNDEHGHQAGDLVLQRVAGALKGALADHPGEPPVYRHGGEEFAVLLPEAGLNEARAVGEQLRAAVEAGTFAYQDLRLAVTISVGVATTTGEEADVATSLVKSADEKLYRAKREGRNRVVA